MCTWFPVVVVIIVLVKFGTCTSNITCSGHSDCTIVCDYSNFYCNDASINGSNAMSLTIHCNEGCWNSSIFCPYTNNTSCNISCLSKGCYYTSIYVTANITKHLFV
eukprot:107445_1